MISLRSFIEENDLTQHEAAELFDISQPRVSDLVNKKIEKFSIDTLINMHDTAGIPVYISIGKLPVEDSAV
jgi:predicted XRE-type DNA-binding protein